jgi:hypothetical protein
MRRLKLCWHPGKKKLHWTPIMLTCMYIIHSCVFISKYLTFLILTLPSILRYLLKTKKMSFFKFYNDSLPSKKIPSNFSEIIFLMYHFLLSIPAEITPTVFVQIDNVFSTLRSPHLSNVCTC